MTDDNASAVRIDLKRPTECSSVELKLFYDTVSQSGEVTEIGLRQRILSAQALAIAYEQGCLVGVAALKVPNPNYRQNTFSKAKTALSPEQFPDELGWVFIHEAYRGRKISYRLVQELIATSHSNIYATSRSLNANMHRTLERAGFSRYGSEFLSDMNSGEKLMLFARFRNNLRRLERASGLPFRQQWAFEWKNLRDRLRTRYTRYPHYFDDVSDARGGIVGQYWQRMRDVYLSAYLRTLAYAASECGLPQRIAEGYCLDIVDGIAGLFEMDPGERPEWLSDFPERFCALDADFASIARELFAASRQDNMRLASLDMPIGASVQKHARLQVSVHLVTPDYELPLDTFLLEKMTFLMIDGTFELKGPPADITLEETSSPGLRGDEVAVCNCLLPIPFGCWQGDYFNVGLAIPAPYILNGTQISCTPEGIDLKAASGELVSTTRVWNDEWSPPHPRGGSTRCGTVTMMDAGALDQARQRLGRCLALSVRLRIWAREKDYGDYVESERSALVLV